MSAIRNDFSAQLEAWWETCHVGEVDDRTGFAWVLWLRHHKGPAAARSALERSPRAGILCAALKAILFEDATELYRAEDWKEHALFRRWVGGGDIDAELSTLLSPRSREWIFALKGQWAEVLGGLESERSTNAVRLAILAAQRLQDRAAVEVWAARGVEALAEDPGGAGWAALVEKLVDVGDVKVVLAALEAKIAQLGTGDAVTAERACTHYIFAEQLERAGQPESAAEHVGLAAASEAGLPLLALRNRARLERSAKRHAQAASAWMTLAHRSADPWSRPHLERAAESWGRDAHDLGQTLDLVGRLHDSDPADPVYALWAAHLFRDAGRNQEFAAVLVRHGEAAHEPGVLRLGVWALEAAGLPTAATWKKVVELEPTLANILCWVRALGPEARVERLEAYRHIGVHDGGGFVVAALVALEAGDVSAAERDLTQAQSRAPDDLLCHFVRCELYRRKERLVELRAALKTLAASEPPRAKAQTYRELGELELREFRNRTAAREYLEQALRYDPAEFIALETLGSLAAEAHDFGRAIELWERVLKGAGETPSSARLWCRLGEALERSGADSERATSAFRRALELDANSLAAIDGLLGKLPAGDPERIELLRKKSLLDPSGSSIVSLDVARLEAQRGNIDAAVAALETLLTVQPKNTDAFAECERLGRAHERWEFLARVFARAPSTIENLRVLVDALQRLERWKEVAVAKEKMLSLVTDPGLRAQTARSLGELYERLGDPQAAIAAWQRADEAEPSKTHALLAMQRLFADRGQVVDLLMALKRELEQGDAIAVSRRIEIWRKLGDIYRTNLDRLPPAIEAYENALKLDDQDAHALACLSEIYAKSGDQEKLAQVLAQRTSVTGSPDDRAQVWLRRGESEENEGKLDEAATAFEEAFRANPGNRTAFTACERIYYRLQKWRSALELYDHAISVVENEGLKAYRLVDLYARRGHVQSQYLSQPGEAAASYIKVLELNPDDEPAAQALSKIFSQESDWAGLISMLEKHAELVSSDEARVHILRRAVQVARSKLDEPSEEFERIYRKIHQINPADLEAIDVLEQHYQRHRDWSNLVHVLEVRARIAAAPKDAIELHRRIAQMAEESLGNLDRAIAAHQAILAIDPLERSAMEALARLYEGTEQWQELVDVTRRQIRLVGEKAQKALLYFKCGSVMELKFNREEEAIQFYHAAIRTSSSCLPAVHGLRDIFLRRQDWGRVIQTLEHEAKLWNEEKERAGVLAHIGQIYHERLGQEDKAIGYFEQALKVDADCLPANRALFELFYSRGEFTKALPFAMLLTQRLARDGDPAQRAEFLRKRAMLAQRAGEYRAAAESLVAALELVPEGTETLDLLCNLCRASMGPTILPAPSASSRNSTVDAMTTPACPACCSGAASSSSMRAIPRRRSTYTNRPCSSVTISSFSTPSWRCA